MFAKTIENPGYEVVLSRFSTIWKVKGDKIYRGYEITQLADETHTKAMNSYAERNYKKVSYIRRKTLIFAQRLNNLKTTISNERFS